MYCSCLQGALCTSEKFMAEEGLGCQRAQHVNPQLQQKLREGAARGGNGVYAVTSSPVQC